VFSVLIALHQYTLRDFANAHAYFSILHQLWVIKQGSANGGTQSYMAIIISFRNEIRNTEQHHLSGHWSSGSALQFRIICREFEKRILPWNYLLSVKYSTVLWLIELQIRRRRKV